MIAPAITKSIIPKSEVMSRYSRTFFAISVAFIPFISSCVTEDEVSCEEEYRAHIVYDYDMAFADAFPHDATPISLWLFPQGTCLPPFHSSYTKEELKEMNYTLPLDVEPGIYDILVWGGVDAASPFSFSKEKGEGDIGVRLRLEGEESPVSDRFLGLLYHGLLRNIELKESKGEEIEQTVTIPLTRDTHLVNVMLQSIDGTPLPEDEFEVSIINSDNSILGSDNLPDEGPLFTYLPFKVSQIATDFQDIEGVDETFTSVSALLEEFSVSRIMKDAKMILSVRNLENGREIIRIPLAQYLLLVKGEYGVSMTDQEYLDRQYLYTLTFFIDANREWYVKGGIYINSWHVVPPQTESF